MAILTVLVRRVNQTLDNQLIYDTSKLIVKPEPKSNKNSTNK